MCCLGNRLTLSAIIFVLMTLAPPIAYGDESLSYVKTISVKVLPAIEEICASVEGIEVSAQYVLGNADLYKNKASDCSMVIVPSIQLHPTLPDLCFGSLNAALMCNVATSFIGEQMTMDNEVYPLMPLYLWLEYSPVLYYSKDSHVLNGQTELIMKAFVNDWRDSQAQ